MKTLIKNHALTNQNILQAVLFWITSIAFIPNAIAGSCDLDTLKLQTKGHCQLTDITFSTAKIAGAHFAWDFNQDGTIDRKGDELNKVSTQYASTGTFTPRVTITINECQATLSTTIFIRSIAKPVFTVNQFCDSVALVNYTDQADSFQWQISDGTNSKQYAPSHVFDRSGLYEVRLQTFKNGCAASKTEDVEIAKIKATPTWNLQEACAPATVAFNSTITPEARTTWYINGEAITQDVAFEKTFTNPGIITVAYNVENHLGCKDSVFADSAIQINEGISAAFSISKDAVCDNDKVLLNNQSSAADIYEWHMGDGEVLRERSSFTYNYAPGEYELKLIAKRIGDGCLDTFTYPRKVRVYKTPDASFVTEQSKGCIPFSVNLMRNTLGEYQNSFLVINQKDTLDGNTQEYTFTNPGFHEVTFVQQNTHAQCAINTKKTFEAVDTSSSAFIPEVQLVTVENEDHLILEWSQPRNTESFQLYRNDGSGFSLLSQQKDTNYTDYSVAVDSVEYQYRVSAISACGTPSQASEIANNMVLKGTYQTDSFPTLRWSEYLGWSTGVASYNVYRDNGYGFEKVGSTTKPYFIDQQFDNGETLESTYKVEAVQRNGEALSWSNTWNFAFKPAVYIPNAFSPNYDNVNDEFEIKGHGFDRIDIKIFNKWGEEVFDSEGEMRSWDGTFRNEKVQTGVYVCVVEASSPNGRKYTFQQTLQLIQ